MIHQFILRKCDGEILAGNFGENDLLFLVSLRSEMSLKSSLCGSEIVYAIFVRRRSRITGILLNPIAGTSSGNIVFYMKVGTIIEIGLSKYEYVKPGKHRFHKRSCLLLAAIPVVVICSITLYLRIVPPLFVNRSSADFEKKIEKSSDDVSEMDSIIGEASFYIREHKFEQARMSLAEAIAKYPSNLRAKELLSELDAAAPESGRKEKDAAGDTKWSNAKDAFEMATIEMDNGNHLEAIVLFDEAWNEVAEDNPKPVFFEALISKRRELKNLAKEQLSMIKLELASLKKTSKKSGFSDELRRLAQIKERTKKYVIALPDDGEARSLANEVGAQMRNAADKWLITAATAEELAGCSRALPSYKEALEIFESLGLTEADKARSGVERCVRR